MQRLDAFSTRRDHRRGGSRVRLRIVTPVQVYHIDTRDGRSAAPRAIPCHRCGVCCERWQPLLTTTDAARLAARLDLPLEAFHGAYTTPYPFDDEQRLLRQEDGHCIFLAYEADGRSTCSVHDARPQVCRDWAAGLDKKECIQGLERFASPAGLIQIEDLYPDPADRATLTEAFAR
jgi:Fe-S-cluster containining protein